MTAFKPMLAKEGNPSDLSYPVFAQIKYDGIRCSIVNGVAVSRTLKPIRNAEIQAMLGRPELNGLDGELIVGDPAAPGCMQATSSFVMAPNKTGAWWTFYVFDKWDEPGPYTDRRTAAGVVMESTDITVIPPQYLWPATYVECYSEVELEEFEKKAVADGHEGIIVRTVDSPYKFGRSGKTGPLLKIKRFIDFEAEVIGVYEKMHNSNEATRNLLGRTERSTKKAGMVGVDTLGGLVLKALNGPHKGETFRCGTGFNDEQRQLYWCQATTAGTIKGRIAKIKSFPVGVKDAPRFPVFLGWRDPEDMS